jgi:pimeloyl-ACP methyl ester carboxylesterase
MDILLIGGLWLDGSAWSSVVPVLESLGHRGVPLTLPAGPDATLDDQVAAVLAAVKAAPGRCVVAGHSAACTLAWAAADHYPERIAATVLIGGFPSADGSAYADFFPITDGAMPFPGWSAFDDADVADLPADTRRDFEASAVPVPEAVARGTVRWTGQRRSGVPVTVVCPEFSPAQARKWIADGEVAELGRAAHVGFADIDSGHWPMFTRPAELARVLASVAASAGEAADDRLG